MKLFTRGTTSVLAAIVVASMAFAQGGGGQGRGGQRGGMQGGNRFGEMALLGRADVQKDLALTSDQVTKLDEMREKARGAGGQRGQGGGAGAGGGGGQRGQGGGGGQRGGNPPTEEERLKMQQQAEERRQAQRKELLTVISEGQLKRLGEIGLQLQGHTAIVSPDVQKALALSTDQIEKIKVLQAKLQEANRGLFQMVQSGELERDQIQEKMTKNNETMKVELAKILTSEQEAKFKTMQGKTFVADPAGL